MVSLIALKPHRYDGRLVRKGQTFAARSADDALVLVMLGVAGRLPEPEPPPAPEPPHVDEPIAPGSPVDAPEPRKRRHYRRKDLVAED